MCYNKYTIAASPVEKESKLRSNKKRRLADLTIRDNFMFAAVMTDKENCRKFLKMAIGIDVKDVEASYEKSFMYHPEYKGVRLDVMATGEDNTLYNIEIQVENRHIEKRSRYYHSQMDMNMLLSGSRYETMPDTYVIFVCDYDPVGEKKYRYTFRHMCNEAPLYELKDGSHTVFLSTTGENDEEEPEELVKFLKFVRADLKDSMDDFGDEYVSRLQESVIEVKESREMEVKYMLLEEMLRDEHTAGVEEGIARGIELGHSKGMSESIIAILSGFDTVSEELKERIMSENDISKLSKMVKFAARAESIEEFEKEFGN